MRGAYTSEDIVDTKGNLIARQCTLCGITKPIEQFAKNGAYGYRKECKQCYNIKRRENATKKRHADFIGGMKRRGEVVVSYSHEDWKQTVIFFKGECAYCGKTMKRGERLTRDHLVAVKEGGLTTQENIVPACSSCNSAKGAREWRDWFMAQPFFSQERMNRIYQWRSIIRAAGIVDE